MGFRSTLAAPLAALFFCASALCHSSQPTAAGQPIVIGERFQLRSEAIGEMRSYFVHRHASYDLSNARYPVLIVLDGEDEFQHASTTSDMLADAGRIPAMLVVGIPNTKRDRDLIPYDPQNVHGAENFLKFITTELMPRIERDYRTQPHRVLVGHSNGGLFGLYALISAPEQFKGYILASPSLGARDRQLPKTLAASLEQRKGPPAGVYLTTANEDSLLSGNWELASSLQDQVARDSRWSFTYRRYPEETHGTVPLRSVYDGLEFLFDGWQSPNASALYEQGGLAAIEKYYNTRAARFGVPAAVPSGLLGSLAIQLYRQKRVGEAEQLVLRAIELNPNDTDAHLIAGRLYFDRGDKAKSVEYLKRALFLGPTRRSIGVDYAALNLDPAAVVPAVTVSASDLQKCVGAYGYSVPAVEIARRGDKLFATIKGREDELVPMSQTRFYFTQDDEVITFRRDERGRVVGLALQNRAVELARLK